MITCLLNIFFISNNAIYIHTRDKEILRNLFGNTYILYNRTCLYHGIKLWNPIVREIDINVSYSFHRHLQIKPDNTIVS